MLHPYLRLPGWRALGRHILPEGDDVWAPLRLLDHQDWPVPIGPDQQQPPQWAEPIGPENLPEFARIFEQEPEWDFGEIAAGVVEPNPPIAIGEGVDQRLVDRALRLNNPKNFLYIRSNKSDHISQQVEIPEEQEKPLFIKDPRRMKPKLTVCEKFGRWVDDKTGATDGVYYSKDFETDADLVMHLRGEAAFCKRSPALMLVLKHKAYRFMEKYDLSLITEAQRYQIVMRAVAQAFMEDHEQYKIRWLCGLSQVKGHIKDLNSFLTGGLLNCSSKTASQPAWMEYVLVM